MTVTSIRRELGPLVKRVLDDLSRAGKIPAPAVDGDAALLARKITGRCAGTNRTDLLAQLQTLAYCSLVLTNGGTKVLVLLPGSHSRAY